MKIHIHIEDNFGPLGDARPIDIEIDEKTIQVYQTRTGILEVERPTYGYEWKIAQELSRSLAVLGSK